MGDTAAYLVHGFSYASAIPNESKQGNPMHALGESISFGRYMNEPLSWEKWSTFSHKKYVEEAERYAQPGSVAQKKAFFEAHYKKIAAQKAAALLEQENAAAAKREAEKDADLYPEDQQRVLLNNNSDLDVCEKIEEVKIQNSEDVGVVTCNEQNSVDVEEIGKDGASVVITEDEAPVKRNSINQLDDNNESQDRISVSESSGTPQIERPLLKQNSVASEDVQSVTSKKRSTSISSLKSSIQRKTWRIPATPSEPITPLVKKENNVTESAKKSNVDSIMENKRFSPKSLRALMSLISTKEPTDKEPTSASKKAGTSLIARVSSRPPKDCSTPLKAPLMTAGKGAAKYPAATPQSENKRIKTPIDPSVHGSKTTNPKWQIFSSVSKSLSGYRKNIQSPTAMTPFILRTEERAAKRKQKLEEKFNANETQTQKVQTPQRTLKEKAGNGFKKLSNSFCFKARPLPDFYKEREIPKPLVKKTPAVAQSQPTVLTRNGSKKKQGTISMPPPPPPPKSLTKNGSSKNLSSRKSSQNFGKLLTTSLPERNTHENASPNIVQ